eukprot:403336949
MMLQNSAYEPRRTFHSINNDYVSKTQFKQHATQTVHYQVNGTGRDSYINRDNGGFCKMYDPYPYKYGQVGTFAQKRHYVAPAPTMAPMNVFYRSDGTGRDSYVTQTNGGLTNTGRMLHQKDAFKMSLRQYNDPRTTSCYPYVKLGGKTAGFDKAKSTNTFSHSLKYKTIDHNNPLRNSQSNIYSNNFLEGEEDQQLQYSPTSNRQQQPQNYLRSMSQTAGSGGFYPRSSAHIRRDYLLESQLTYDHKFHRAQQELRKEQKSMDNRLARPKYSRQQSNRVQQTYDAKSQERTVSGGFKIPNIDQSKTIQH